VLMSGAVVSAYQLLQSGERQDISFASQQEGTFINRKLEWALAHATSFSLSSSTTMVITRPDMQITVDGSGPQMTLARGSAPAQTLETVGLDLENVVFSTTPPANGLPEAVHVSYTLGGKDFTYAMYLRQ